ncbi:MAG: hypothetical protein ACK4VO_11065 [Pseudobdellovibrio sp.]
MSIKICAVQSFTKDLIDMADLFRSGYYFFVIFALGLIPMKYCMKVSKELDEQMHLKMSHPSGQHDFSSMSNQVDLYSYDQEDFSFSDDELLNLTEISDEDWGKSPDVSDPYALSPQQLEEMDADQEQAKSLDIEYGQIGADDALVQYEDVAKCKAKPARLLFQKSLTTSPIVAKLIVERENESSILPRRCVTHVMNRVGFGAKSLAQFPSKPVGAPKRNGAKPCITKEMVNVTYNSFVDVAECLNFSPKDLLPKLFNESGMIINTLGAGWDTGVGQLTGVAIEEVNKYYDTYVGEMFKAAKLGKPSCALIANDKFKPLLTKVNHDMKFRNGLIAAPANPLKNIVYMAVLNRMNLDNLIGSQYRAGKDYIDNQEVNLLKFNSKDVGGKFGREKIYDKFAKLGMPDVNLYKVAVMVALLGYNTGNSTAFNMLNEYLDRRIAARKSLNDRDFDFHNPAAARDIDGTEKSVIDIAKAFIRAPMIKKGDRDVKIKLQRTKLIHDKMRTAHLLTFPEFVIYNQNNYDRSILNPINAQAVKSGKASRKQFPSYAVIGGPGYLSALASKDKELQRVFRTSTEGASYCSDPRYLKVK